MHRQPTVPNPVTILAIPSFLNAFQSVEVSVIPTMAIPSWTGLGVLPPINPDDPIGAVRSPYGVSLTDVVLRFGTSPERCRILDGLLRLRAELHRSGFVRGFQWLDGSFLEHVEVLEKRSPRDVDVVTFVAAPDSDSTPDPDEQLFDHDWVKANFSVDHYFVELNLPSQELVSWSAYWYSVWSHRRTQLWKGFLEIELTPKDDDTARAQLVVEDLIRNGGQP